MKRLSIWFGIFVLLFLFSPIFHFSALLDAKKKRKIQHISVEKMMFFHFQKICIDMKMWKKWKIGERIATPKPVSGEEKKVWKWKPKKKRETRGRKSQIFRLAGQYDQDFFSPFRISHMRVCNVPFPPSLMFWKYFAYFSFESFYIHAFILLSTFFFIVLLYAFFIVWVWKKNLSTFSYSKSYFLCIFFHFFPTSFFSFYFVLCDDLLRLFVASIFFKWNVCLNWTHCKNMENIFSHQRWDLA